MQKARIGGKKPKSVNDHFYELTMFSGAANGV